jgi:arsenite-transporting ATPase
VLLKKRILFFGGKGGVGKTTCAAAWAVAAARAGRRVLAVSTDPAHSLGDALGMRIAPGGTTIPMHRTPGAKPRARSGTLRVVELDAPRAFARWLAEHRRALGDILEHGSLLDREDVEALLELSVPGVDELVGVLEIARLAGIGTDAVSRSPGYEDVVVDTAPTGHTWRLLDAPQAVGSVAEVLADLEREHRLIREQLARVGGPEAADLLIELLSEQAREAGELLRDRSRTTFCWVMLPESLSLSETEDALAVLEPAGLHVSTLVINRVVPRGPACPVCDRRRSEESRVIARVDRTIGRGRIRRLLESQDAEPRGVAALGRLGAWLQASPRAGEAVSRRPRAATGSGLTLSLPREVGRRARLSIAELDPLHLLFVGGKGGVGKTTTAAALALMLARRDPARRVLLLSTDPAHSLGDVFGAKLGDVAAPVPSGPSNLGVRELDAAAALADRRAELESAIDEIVSAFGAGTVTATGSQGIGKLIELAPPGIDELLGLLSVVDLLRADRDDLVVVDTAPTGHALRLLEMPDAAREWSQTLLRMLLKYRNLVRPGRLAAELLDLSKSIRALQELMRTPGQARFMVVTRAAEVPRLETGRLLASLKRLGVDVPVMLVNAMTLAPRRCPRCRRTAATERREVTKLTRACRGVFRECVIIQTPLAAPPPRSAGALERWARAWTT